MPTVPNDPGPPTVIPQVTPGPSFGEVMGAELRQSNTVVNAFQALKSMGSFAPEDGYSNWDQIKDEPKYLEHAYRFAGLQSQAETDNLKSKIDQDESDRRTLSAAGPMGIVAGAVSGFLDPTMLLPGRVAIGVLKDGAPLVRGALEVGGAMGVQSAAQESVLQATQPGRSLGESVVNVGSATILGALLGGAAAWLSPAEHAAAVAGLDRDRARMDANVVGRPAPVDELKVRSDINRLFNDEIGRNELSPEAAALYDKMPEDIRKASEAIANNNNKFDRFLTEDDILDEEDLAPIRADRKKAAEEAAPKVQEWFRQNLPAASSAPHVVETPVYTSPPMAAAAGAAATDTRTISTLAIAPTGTGLEKVGFDKGLQSMNSPFLATRKAHVGVAELPLMTVGNKPVQLFEAEIKPILDAEGRPVLDAKGLPTFTHENRPALNAEGLPIYKSEVTSPDGAPLESIARTQKNTSQWAVRDLLADMWKELRFGDAAPKGAMARDALGAIGFLGDRGDKPTFEQFKVMVSEAIQAGNKHEFPQVQKAAEYVSREVFEKWAVRAEGALSGEGFKRAQQVIGEGYFPHLWNKTKIAARRSEFGNKLTQWYANDQAAKRATQGRLSGLSERLKSAQEAIEKLAGKEGKETELADAVLEHDRIRGKIEEEIGSWEGKSSTEAKAAIKAREKYAEKAERPEGASRLRSADDAIDKAVKHILKSDRNVSMEDLRAKAEQTINRILGSPDGRLAYDERPVAATPHGTPDGELRGSLEKRHLNVPNSFAHGWVEEDIEKVVHQHLRTFIPDVLLAERFGDVKMENVFRELDEEANRMVAALPPNSEKAATALEKARQRDITNLAATRDTFRGLYRIPTDGASRNMGRISAAVRNASVILNMGMGMVSSIADSSGPVFRHGMMNVFGDAWWPYLKSLSTNQEYSKEVVRQFRSMGISNDVLNSSRNHVLGGMEDGYEPHSPFERTLQKGADKMQIVNGLAYWTDRMKFMSASVAMQEIYRAAKAEVAGTATKKQIANLRESNIEPHVGRRIAELWEESGNRVDGILLPNTADWKGAGADRAREIFEAALGREVNISVVTPGIDKPKWMSDPTLAILGQFKSFAVAATTRIMIANLQRADAQTLQGVVASVGMGMLSYKIASVVSGQPTSDRPQDWIKEGMSRGNIFGILEEGNTIAAKLTRGKVDVYRAIGADKPLAKSADASAAEQLLGPTFKKLKALNRVTGAAAGAVAGDGNLNAGDIHALRTLIGPGQNLPGIRSLFDQVETGAANAFGIPPKQ